MKKELLFVTMLASTATLAPFVSAQSTEVKKDKGGAPRKKAARKSGTDALAAEVHQMRVELQAQIDALKTQLAAKDAQIEALQRSTQTVVAVAATQLSAAQVQTIDTATKANTAAVAGVQISVSELKAQTSAVAANVQQVQKTTEKIQRSVEEPVSFRYKGVTLTPGGFIAGESVWRQRAMNADVYTDFALTPYMNSGEARTSEWVPSARGTRPTLAITGKVPFGTLNAFLEVDFLTAAVTSNNLQSNSYTPRIRQAWAQAVVGKAKFTGGQMWSLMTENKRSTDAGQEALPLVFDANLHVGETYLRQLAFRVQDQVTPKVTLAMSLEGSQYQFSASNAPSNFFFGAPGAFQGLNNTLFNYTNQVAPDVAVKATYDPGYGHYELGGVVRFFRDRYYPNATSVGAQNDTRVGAGFVANARFPVMKKVDLGLHLLAGNGTGRYGASLLPDITVKPNGTLAPLRNAQGLFSLEVHPTKRLDLFGYAGTEYVQRTVYANSAGVLVGYAPITGNNTGCNTEGVPTAGTGFAPGSSTCLGATRVVIEGSAGWVYRIYSGPAGRLQYGAAYSYLTRSGWSGVGGAPKATNNMVFTSFRYYLP